MFCGRVPEVAAKSPGSVSPISATNELKPFNFLKTQFHGT